jgi:hypothetical protein
MRGVSALFVASALAHALGCGGSGVAMTPVVDPPPARAGRPSWLPPYSPKQLALLAPVDKPITVPAVRAYPDITRFGYANSEPLSSAEKSFEVTKMVAQLLTRSPRLYMLGEAPPELANLVAQYGPAPQPEPDGFRVARRAARGAGELMPATFTEAARGDYELGRKRAAAHDQPGAIAALRSAVVKSPNVPAVRLAYARALADSGRLLDAEAAFREGLSVDVTYAPFHVGLAELAEKRNDGPGARRALAEGLAYQPTSKAGLALAARLGAGTMRVRPIAIFIDVDAVGAVHVATQGGGPQQLYAGCRAVMRYEPELRAVILEQALDTPYYLTVIEEVVCLEAALGSYLFDRRDGAAKPDPELDALLKVAREDGLTGYAMFEILGQHRPERARLAPAPVHAAIVRYVERHVLGQATAPEGVYTASRGGPAGGG